MEISKSRITDDIFYVGINDPGIDLFEGQYSTPNGMSYNSYVIADEKIAVMDTVEKYSGTQWLENIKEVCGDRNPDYLVIHHMEPDHSANITAFTQTFPEAVVVSSSKAFTMMNNFYGSDYADRRMVVGEGDTLSLGKHVLSFVGAPMVHWPEVIVSYDSNDKILFSADGFGRFGTVDCLPAEDWADEARRYYIGIVGKYGAQVQSLLKKAANLDISKICPLHGPVLDENIAYYINLYNTWSSYQTETEGVMIAYSSVYGNTEKAVTALYESLQKKGCENIKMYDLSRADMSEAVADAFRFGKITLASVTYNADVFPKMKIFISGLTERNLQNKKIGLIENGSWAPVAAKKMREMLEGCKNTEIIDCQVKILSSLSEENITQIDDFASQLID